MNYTIEQDPLAGMRGRVSDARFLRNGGLFFVTDLLWISAANATLLVPSPTAAMLCMAAVSLLWTIGVVKRSGGSYLLPSSVMYIASCVFLGFASYYLVVLGSTTEPAHIRVTVVILFSATVLIEIVRSALLLRWRVVWTVPDATDRHLFQESSPRHFLGKAFILLAVARTPMVLATNSEMANAIGLVGVFMIVLTGLSWRNRIRWGGDLLFVMVSIALPILWVSFVFKGGGRLTVAGLGIAVALMWNVVKPSMWFKVAILLSVPVFMIGAAVNRTDRIEARYGVTEAGSPLKSAAGLYSMYDPLDRFSTVVLEPGFPGGKSIGPRYGATFVNTAMMPIPRNMWEGKPAGFGAEVTALMSPESVRIGQSYAILSFGEWYANFGWIGVFVMPICFGWLVAVLDRRHAYLVNLPATTYDDWWRMVILGCLVSSLGDLYWSGTFTFYTRGGMACLVAVAMWKLSRGRAVGPPVAPEPVASMSDLTSAEHLAELN